MKVQLMCAGYVILEGQRKGITYIPYENGQLNVNEPHYFTFKRHLNWPVGTLLEGEREKNTFSGLHYTNERPDIAEEVLQTYRIKSVAALEELKIENLRKNGANINNQIENMTIKQLKERIKGDIMMKHYIRYYLLEMF